MELPLAFGYLLIIHFGLFPNETKHVNHHHDGLHFPYQSEGMTCARQSHQLGEAPSRRVSPNANASLFLSFNRKTSVFFSLFLSFNATPLSFLQLEM